MTDEKQTGARPAAEELVQLCEREYPPGFGRTRIAFCATVDKFEAIILRHCPEDKGAEKLVKALRTIGQAGNDIADMADEFIATGDKKSLRNYGGNIASIAQFALAEYEELNK